MELLGDILYNFKTLTEKFAKNSYLPYFYKYQEDTKKMVTEGIPYKLQL
jgi:hypothetical protein